MNLSIPPQQKRQTKTMTDNRYPDIVLRRIPNHSKDYLITWELLNKDQTVRLGFIFQSKGHPLFKKRMGWQYFPIKYWVGFRFNDAKVESALTRRDIIKKLLDRF